MHAFPSSTIWIEKSWPLPKPQHSGVHALFWSNNDLIYHSLTYDFLNSMKTKTPALGEFQSITWSVGFCSVNRQILGTFEICWLHARHESDFMKYSVKQNLKRFGEYWSVLTQGQLFGIAENVQVVWNSKSAEISSKNILAAQWCKVQKCWLYTMAYICNTSKLQTRSVFSGNSQTLQASQINQNSNTELFQK